MIAATVALLFPLLSVFPYRRAGLGWPRAAAFAVAAVGLTVLGLAGALFYSWAVTIGAALCGSTPTLAGIAAFAAYLVVAVWAALRPRRVWAWAVAPAAGAAVLILASYFFAGAHDYCET